MTICGYVLSVMYAWHCQLWISLRNFKVASSEQVNMREPADSEVNEMQVSLNVNVINFQRKDEELQVANDDEECHNHIANL